MEIRRISVKPKPVIRLLMDSGAYTAWTQDKIIEVKDYANFLESNIHHLCGAINLDVIDPKNPEQAAKLGADNYDYLRSRGILTLPVFHSREHLRWLDKMLSETDHIGLASSSINSVPEKQSWYELMWNYVTDANGFPIANFHSFGDTSPTTLLNYPWYSADSSTWIVQAGRAARVSLQGKAYQLRSKSIGNPHFLSLDDPEPKRKAWEEEIRSRGLNPDVVMRNLASPTQLAMMRSYLNGKTILRLAEKARSVTKYNTTLFSIVANKKQPDGGTERKQPIELFFVVSPAAWFFNAPLLLALNIRNVLVSYYYVKTSPKKFWEEQFVPFLYDPLGFCTNGEPKIREYWEKLNEFLYKEPELVESLDAS